MGVCLPGKHELTKHLEGMQASLALQDEAVQRGEIQNRILSEELDKMNNSQQITEAEAKALQVNTVYTNTWFTKLSATVTSYFSASRLHRSEGLTIEHNKTKSLYCRSILKDAFVIIKNLLTIKISDELLLW